MISKVFTSDVGQLAAVMNQGKVDEVVLERVQEVGITIRTPNGQVIFLSDEMIDDLVEFQLYSFRKESQ